MSLPFIADLEEERVRTVIILPYPDKRLSPNCRLHPKVKGAIGKKARADAHYLALEAAGYSLGSLRADLAGDGPIDVRFTFYPPDNRHRDLDNAVASLKWATDGVADALHVNDRRFVSSYSFGASAKPGRVEVVIG